MKQSGQFFAALGLMVAMFSASGQANEQDIRKVFQAKIPGTRIISIQKLSYAGLYEVAIDGPDGPAIYYSDASAQVILIGSLFETRTDRNLTEERLRRLAAIDWKQLPFQWAVTTRRGNGRRQIAIFSDPNCPYCRQFEKDLATVDDITIHIFMYPVIKPESVRQTKSVWCSKDRARAWNDLMLKGVEPTAPTDCEYPIDDLLALGRRLGATSTPTWFLPNGEKNFGAQPMSKVIPMLDTGTRRQ